MNMLNKEELKKTFKKLIMEALVESAEDIFEDMGEEGLTEETVMGTFANEDDYYIDEGPYRLHVGELLDYMLNGNEIESGHNKVLFEKMKFANERGYKFHLPESQNIELQVTFKSEKEPVEEDKQGEEEIEERFDLHSFVNDVLEMDETDDHSIYPQIAKIKERVKNGAKLDIDFDECLNDIIITTVK